MTSLPASRRDFACQTPADEERSAVADLVLPDLPQPSRAAQAVMSFFARSEPIHLLNPTTRYLH